MIYFMALIPATVLTIAGYFVLYLSNRSEGSFRALGKYLGFWAFTLAGLVVLGAIFAAAHAGRGGAMIGMRGMHGMHGPMHCPWSGEPQYFGPRDFEPEAAPGEADGAPNPPAPPGPSAPSTP
jgi:hypothetical protein